MRRLPGPSGTNEMLAANAGDYYSIAAARGYT
jgi:hypothetical protein